MPHKMKTSINTRSIVFEGTMTTISLEDPFWLDLEMIAKENDLTVAELVSLVEDSLGKRSDLSAALRAYIATNRVKH
jgi:predicted DNA-binding ribbon-helix-helix protein